MRERPISFSAPMVRAILAGRKSQTRRRIKPQPDAPSDARWVLRDGLWHPCVDTLCRGVLDPIGPGIRCPYGAPGDRLWVRETFALAPVCRNPDPHNEQDWSVIYRATCEPHFERPWRDDDDNEHRPPWRPSIHMPRWASRITLEITGVRVERLHDITESDARAEGVDPVVTLGKLYPSKYAADVERESYREGFRRLWCKINGAKSWEANPFVWVIEFQRVEAQDAITRGNR